MADKIPANGDLKVLVATGLAAIRDEGIDAPYAAVISDPDNWNDYGRGYFAALWIVREDGHSESMRLQLMIEGYDRSKVALDEFINTNGDPFPIERITIPFVSLVPNEADYQKIIQTFGFDNAIPMLRKLHDAIVVRLEKTDPKLVELTDTEDFHVGVLRQPGARTALRIGGRYFRRDVPKPVADSATKFVIFTKLKSAKNDIEVEFDFTDKPIIRDRIAVLIGRNGVGKTQLLKAIVDSLPTSTAPQGAVDGGPLAPAHSRVLVFSSVPTDPYPTVIPAWLGIDYEYFPVSASRERKNDPLLAALVACRFEHSSARFGPNGDQNRLDVIEGVLERMGLWTRLCLPIRTRTEGENLGNVIEVGEDRYLPLTAPLNELNTLQAVQRIDWERSPAVLDRQMQPRALSSGEYAMLRFAAQATAAIERGSLLLLDEPETHLHPNFVSDLIEVLYGLLRATGSIAIVATHSAYLVREVSRDSVKVMSVDDRVLTIDTPRMQTFGASVDTISQFVFGDTNMDHHYQAILREWANATGRDLGLKAIIERYGSTFNSESLSYIARILNRDEKAP